MRGRVGGRAARTLRWLESPVPAKRRRTEHWRQSLEQIRDRNGSIEITLARHVRQEEPGVITTPAKSLLWRVRVLALSDEEIVVERPSMLGVEAPLSAGADLVAVMTVGQNQWMFRTRCVGQLLYPLNAHRSVGALRLTAPERVERCQRRSFYRVSTIGLALPPVRCAQLLEISSAVPAEEACKARIHRMIDMRIAGRLMLVDTPAGPEMELAPALGDDCCGSLVNIGGGGVGVLFEREEPALTRKAPCYWLELDLTPTIPAPLNVAARLVHTRINSARRLYAGFAFTFDHHPSYERFVVEQLCQCVALMEREQLKRRKDAG
ncbi:MAG: hypothetical protein D6824_01470 [Planctomycetota bacterium]|nr:MAG: hypothetical protein D6824_01470 [Planctomycetota bacterium]